MTSYIYYLLDKSGSMYGNKKIAIRGINEFISDQRKIADCFMSLYLFSFSFKTVFENMPIHKVQDLKEEDYDPDGSTSLYDAMGFLLSEKIDTSKGGKHILIIVTDGEENSSKDYSAEDIKKLVKEAANLEIVYLGSNQDAVLSARNFGGNMASTLSYNDASLDKVLQCASNAVGRFRTQESDSIEFTPLERDISMGR